ncbi:hypothetical protein KC333_g4240 [Hortaea werneckii]|nr:hypothetical protein KC333_g4240 [Hortaea werneckii]
MSLSTGVRSNGDASDAPAQEHHPNTSPQLAHPGRTVSMADENIYDEIEIEDMTWDPTMQIYHYPCPCGDRFEISIDDLRDEETDIAVCPSCSLQIRVIYEVDDLPKPESEQKQEEVKKSVETQAQQPVAAAA